MIEGFIQVIMKVLNDTPESCTGQLVVNLHSLLETPNYQIRDDKMKHDYATARLSTEC